MLGESEGKSSASLLGLKRTQAHSATVSLRLGTWRGQSGQVQSSAQPARVGRWDLDDDDTRNAARRAWDDSADDYQAEHGEFLRDVGFIWCPEGLDEADVRLLGAVRGRDALEVGCGAAQCSRWLVSEGARAVGVDLSVRQLQHSRRIDDETGIDVPVALADAVGLPFRDESFDVACSAFGAVPFVGDSARLMR